MLYPDLKSLECSFLIHPQYRAAVTAARSADSLAVPAVAWFFANHSFDYCGISDKKSQVNISP